MARAPIRTPGKAVVEETTTTITETEVTSTASEPVQQVNQSEQEQTTPYYDSGKVATIGYGSTVHPNGQKVKITDKPIDKKTGMEYLQIHMTKDAQRFNKSMQGVKLSQAEYDLYMDFTYQFGTGAWTGSSMLRNLKAGQHVQACKSLLKWKYVGKKDCSIRSSNCYGVWTRQQARYEKCMEEN